MKNQDYLKTVHSMDALARELLPFQVTDPARPDFGGWFSDYYGFASPCHIGNAKYIFILASCVFCPDSAFFCDGDVYSRLMNAVAFQKRTLKKSGLLDIPFTNFDSPPDTAFALSMLSAAAYIAQKSKTDSGASFVRELDSYAAKCVSAIIADGFHTPNHRWVITSALLQAREVFDVPDVSEKVAAYLGEGIDINPDGFYSEKSTGGYNAVVNRQLTYVYELLGREEIFRAVTKNLENMLYLIHPDGSVVTSVSLRQDKGKKKYPDNCLDSFYYAAMLTGDRRFAAVARALSDKGVFSEYMIYMFTRHPDWQERSLPEGEEIGDYEIFMKNSGVYRLRRGALSLTAAIGMSGALSVTFGKVELAELRLFSPYFAGAKFIAHKMERIENGVRIFYDSEFLLPQLPAYWLPTGAPMPFDELPYKTLERRALMPRPKLYYSMDIINIKDGVELKISSSGGPDAVPFIAELLFVPNGRVESDGISIPMLADETALLKSGDFSFVSGGDAIRVSGANHAHRSNRTGTEGTGGLFRAVISDWTPVVRTITLHFEKWSEAYGGCTSGKGPVSLG